MLMSNVDANIDVYLDADVDSDLDLDVDVAADADADADVDDIPLFELVDRPVGEMSVLVEQTASMISFQTSHSAATDLLLLPTQQPNAA